MGLALVPAGRLGDVRGRRRMFLIGLSSFVLSGAAPTIGLLVAARLSAPACSACCCHS